MKEYTEIINAGFSLAEQETGEYSGMKISGLNFAIRSFEAQGLGHVSVMKAKGFFGLMQMESLMITPFEKDMPLFSTELIKIGGKIKYLAEIYNTLNGECDIEAIKKIDINDSDFTHGKVKPCWYDNLKLYFLSLGCKKKCESKIIKLSEEILEKYISASLTAKDTEDMELKKKHTLYFVDGLINNGGPATDVFVRSLGKEKTADILHKVLFGTER